MCKAFIDGGWKSARYVGMYQFANVIEPSIMIGGHKGGMVAYPVAVVKYESELIELPLKHIRLKD